MQSISIEELTEFLKSDDLKLQATQGKLCFPIIQRIYYKMKIGVEFENINIKEDLIINGHHRYVCLLLLKKSINTNPWSSPSQITVCQWSEVQIDQNDWESIEIIQRHNLKDAAKSGLDIKQFEI
jgi:hypothetical protein